MHLDDVTFQLVLTGGHLLDGLPQRCETLHHLLHLGWVEGGSAGRFRRYGLRSGGFGTGRCRPANLLDRARNHLLRLRRPAKFGSLCRDYLLCCLAVRLPS